MDRKEEINKEIDSLETRIIVLRREYDDILKKRKSSLCVTYEEDEEYSISFLPALSFKYVDGLALMSSKVFEKLYKEVMEKINK